MPLFFPGNPPISSGDAKASSHKLWLENMVYQLETEMLIRAALNGDETGVYMYSGITPATSSFLVEGTDALSVEIQPGLGTEQGVGFRMSVAQTIGLAAPTTNNRIDRVSYDIENQTCVITTGTEDASPVAPTLPTNHHNLATILCRTTMTKVLLPGVADDSTNGFVTDVRVFAN